MRVLVTRPREDAAETVAKLVARGHEALLAPLLEIRFRDGEDIVLDGIQAVLITSANGIRALARRTKRRDMEILAVGSRSAQVARELGFNNARDAGGDAQALADLTIASLTPERGALVYATGSETRVNLVERLRAQRFAVRSEVLYDAIPARTFPPDVRGPLAQGALDAVLFFSPRTARTFSEIVAREGISESCRSLSALCISQAAADELKSLSFRAVRAASHPDQETLLALLGN